MRSVTASESAPHVLLPLASAAGVVLYFFAASFEWQILGGVIALGAGLSWAMCLALLAGATRVASSLRFAVRALICLTATPACLLGGYSFASFYGVVVFHFWKYRDAFQSGGESLRLGLATLALILGSSALGFLLRGSRQFNWLMGIQVVVSGGALLLAALFFMLGLLEIRPADHRPSADAGDSLQQRPPLLHSSSLTAPPS